jgi:formamidopyrimidine-DNA glycosylase
MPELPEVETTRRGIAPSSPATVTGVVIRNGRLRHPIRPTSRRRSPASAWRPSSDAPSTYYSVSKTAACWCTWGCPAACASWRWACARKHDHLDITFGPRALRLRDPRRFGLVLWQPGDTPHPLLAHLGIEPLSDGFDGRWLHQASRGRRTPVKLFLMDAAQVVGSATSTPPESLFRAGIDPTLPVGELGPRRCARLPCIRETLQDALRRRRQHPADFVGSNGSPGYFQQQYFVWTRRRALPPVRHTDPKRIMGQRATFFCARCQH